ncbi:hypothetical protein N752_16240 [Desulforamulus aquiferis]|nr:hypothetical protein N752_16240 [Desulforamulus aquiferis]
MRDGVLNHTGPNKPATLEGQVVKIADRIAYINHDIDDALRAGVLDREDLPGSCLEILGHRHSQRINTMVLDLIKSSQGKSEICMSTQVKQAMDRLRSFMFNNVYIGSEAKTEESKARHLVENLYFYFLNNPNKIPGDVLSRAEQEGIPRVIVDYIAGMTDRFAVAQYKNLYIPHGFPLG